ncbi:MAG TPA: hypothetical protein VHI11_14630 [Jiangellaceae bacterium]|jgi:hypothetical protein|nr:hypothetical protein [Jiangellaceae bacterium]
MTTPVEPPDPQPPDPLPAAPPIAPGGVPPTSLLAAVKLMYVGAGLSLLGMLFALATRSQLRDQMLEEDLEQTAAELDRAVNMASAVSVVIGLIAVGLWLWMAQANGRGEAWARIVATVLFGLNIVLTAYNFAQTTGFGVVINITSIVLSGAILWLLYRKDANAYYAARTGG